MRMLRSVHLPSEFRLLDHQQGLSIASLVSCLESTQFTREIIHCTTNFLLNAEDYKEVLLHNTTTSAMTQVKH